MDPTDEAPSEKPAARVFLQPVAAPSILGEFAFAGASFMAATYLAGWYGGAGSLEYVAPFAASFGGIAQLLAAAWSFKARDGLATAMQGMWGAFWIGFGVLNLLFATGTLQSPLHSGAFAPLAFWFFVLAGITLMGSFAALAENAAICANFCVRTVAATFLGIHFMTGSHAWQLAGGWTMIGASVIAWYTASALMFEEAFRRPILPIGRFPANRNKAKISLGIGEPGVMFGQ